MRLLALISLTAAALALAPAQSRAADDAGTLARALGSAAPAYQASPAALAAAVTLCASRQPDRAAAFLKLALDPGRSDADAIAPSLVRAAIQGLRANPAPGLIAGIVRAAVKAAPTEVLDIVTAAIKASPRTAAQEIVNAALGAVPHPEQLVTVNFLRRAERMAAGGKELDAKDLSAPEKQLTLAEAIVEAALAADPGLTLDTLSPRLPQVPPVEGPPITTVVLAPDVPVLPSPVSP